MKKKVLITGANGFIGAALRKHFEKREYIVYGVGLNAKEGITELNLLEKAKVNSFIAEIQPDILMHCAGSANVTLSVQNPDLDFESNVTATHNLLTAIHNLENYHPRFVFLSSAGVYGNPISLPITENMPYNPLSPYALHKIMCEEACLFYKRNYGLDVKIARIFSAYGPGLRKQIFWDMYKKYKNAFKLNMFGTGHESRDYIEIDDLTNALFLLATGNTEYSIFNVANGKELSIRHVTEIFASIVGLSKAAITFNGTVREGDPINWRADISRIEELGYKQNINIETGLRHFINWAESMEEFANNEYIRGTKTLQK